MLSEMLSLIFRSFFNPMLTKRDFEKENSTSLTHYFILERSLFSNHEHSSTLIEHHVQGHVVRISITFIFIIEHQTFFFQPQGKRGFVSESCIWQFTLVTFALRIHQHPHTPRSTAVTRDKILCNFFFLLFCQYLKLTLKWVSLELQYVLNRERTFADCNLSKFSYLHHFTPFQIIFFVAYSKCSRPMNETKEFQLKLSIKIVFHFQTANKHTRKCSRTHFQPFFLKSFSFWPMCFIRKLWLEAHMN